MFVIQAHEDCFKHSWYDVVVTQQVKTKSGQEPVVNSES